MGELRGVQSVIYGDINDPGLVHRVKNLEASEKLNAEMRREWQSIKDQLAGAKRLAIAIITIGGVLGGAAYASLWNALQQLLKQ